MANDPKGWRRKGEWAGGKKGGMDFQEQSDERERRNGGEEENKEG